MEELKMNKKNDSIELKTSELTGILGRESMNILADVVGAEKWKEYRNLYNQASKLENITDFPIQIDFELNASCNLKCPMCPNSAESSKDRIKEEWFKFEDFKKIIDFGITKGLKAIKLNYINEPLIRKDIIEFITYAKEKGILDIYLSTNGILLTDEFAKKLINSGLTRIQISIDAFTKKTYDAVRPGGNINIVVKNVEQLIKIRNEQNSTTPLIRVNFVRTELNEHELQSFVDYWKDKVEMIGVQEMIKPPESSMIIKSKTTTNKRKNGFRCSMPFKQLVINNSGYILPCCTFYGEQLRMGNIKNDDIVDIWTSEKMKKLREIHKNGNYFEIEVCKNCVDGAVNDNE